MSAQRSALGEAEYSHKHFVLRFGCILEGDGAVPPNHPLRGAKLDESEYVHLIIAHAVIPPGSSSLGMSKVNLRAGAVEVLENMRHKVACACASRLQALLKRSIAQSQASRRREALRVIVKFLGKVTPESVKAKEKAIRESATRREAAGKLLSAVSKGRSVRRAYLDVWLAAVTIQDTWRAVVDKRWEEDCEEGQGLVEELEAEVERMTERLAGLLGQCEEAAKAANEAREGDTVRQTADWGAKMQEWEKDRERIAFLQEENASLRASLTEEQAAREAAEERSEEIASRAQEAEMKAADVTMKRDESDRKREEATKWGNRRREEAEERLQEEVRAREEAEDEVRALKRQVETLCAELDDERGKGGGGELEELRRMYGDLSAEHASLIERGRGMRGAILDDDVHVSAPRVVAAMREWRRGREDGRGKTSFSGPEGSDVLVKKGDEWLVYKDAILESEGGYERAVVEPVVRGVLRAMRDEKPASRSSVAPSRRSVVAPSRGSIAPDQMSFSERRDHHKSRPSAVSRHEGAGRGPRGIAGDKERCHGDDKENEGVYSANSVDADTSGIY